MHCPALDVRDRCMLYEHRPLLCRTFGPVIRGTRRSVLADGCGHFSKDIPEEDFPILSIYKDEDVLLRKFALKDARRVRRIETIIPAALALDLDEWFKE